MQIQKKVALPNKLGLHARPAMQLVELANKFQAAITVEKDGMMVDCKNMIAVLTLGAGYGTILHFLADGPDAEEALESVCGLVEVGFGEE